MSRHIYSRLLIFMSVLLNVVMNYLIIYVYKYRLSLLIIK